ncbi:TetR family transcriptional regulator [Lentzea guizhouensis]|uniref:TetR family transcriptional regulator n=1 Tax=Lentzea guizhouensis TaxID=1586287 RepID=A0A1B2HV09_9PSEU|nr:TetR/AcrR family transcriptional regulator [Lentzea guizhouensis]ANZ41561.1 TetR family transcriptional regulator [Lentzea guizhouensis]
MVHNVRGQVSEARQRLLATATRIFYAEGIHSVGIDRIVAEAKVTRATLYRHFASKDELVVAYLQAVAQMERDQFEKALDGGLPAPDALRVIAASIAAGIESAGFRGCAFLNAAAEYPDRAHPVLRAVLDHREWFLTTVTDLFARLDEKSADSAGRHFVMLRDGAMAAGCLTDATEVGATFLAGVEGLLTFRTGMAAPLT